MWATSTPTAVVVVLQAVQLASQIFSLIEEIRGSFLMSNPGDSEAKVEILSDLVTGNELGEVVESFTCVATLPAKLEMGDVQWCSGIYAEQLGMHAVVAQEGGNDPVSSDIFEVVE